MRNSVLFAFAAVLAVALAYSPVWAQSQTEPQKTQQGPTQPTPPEQKTPIAQPGGQVGGMDDQTNIDYVNLMKELDLTMQRMTTLAQQSQVLSKSFGEIAATHHGADQSEVLMMQRMSDSMGTMAGEIRMSLQQYKKMLDDETSSQSGQMKNEVQSLKRVLDGIAKNVEEGIQTLQKLQVALGQG